MSMKKKTKSLSGLKSRQGKKLALMALPIIIYIFIFKYLPLWGLSYAFIEYKPGRALLKSAFVGLKNFTVLFANPVIRENTFQSIINTFGMNFIEWAFKPLPMLFAIFLSELKSKKFKKFIQTVSTLPHFVSWVVMYSLIFALLSLNGPVNTTLVNLGIIDKPVNILNASGNVTVWLTQTLYQVWKGLGWGSIIYFSALASIDQEVVEASMVDGAGRMKRIWYITLPHLMPTFVVVMIMTVAAVLSTGMEQYYLFENAMNTKYITTLDLYVYKLGIGSGQAHYATAVGIMKSIVALVLFYSCNYLSKKVRGSGIA